MPLRNSTTRLVWALGFIVAVAIAPGCATSEYRMGSDVPEVADRANPHPATYGSDAFTFGKKQKIRSENDQTFFFKHCDLGSPRSYYSKTSYDCSRP